MFTLKKDELKYLLSSWSKEAEVFAPQKEEGQVMLLPFEESTFTMDYINFAFPVKEHLFKQKEILFTWENDNGKIKAESPEKAKLCRRIYFGVRPCDIHGIKYMDKFFLEGYTDRFYRKNREAAIFIAVNCVSPGESCFCSSMGTGPLASSGYDLLLTPVDGVYLVEVGTDKGAKLLSSAKNYLAESDNSFLEAKEAVNSAALNKFTTKINAENISALLEANFDNPVWQKLSKECILCTGCTTLCPTCTCFNVVEENKGKNSGCRVRYWDSCQSDSFTRNAKEHNPRSSAARVRYRIYDKLKYIEDRFNMKGCVGCGRCINVCPASINIVDIINSFADKEASVETGGGE